MWISPFFPIGGLIKFIAEFAWSQSWLVIGSICVWVCIKCRGPSCVRKGWVHDLITSHFHLRSSGPQGSGTFPRPQSSLGSGLSSASASSQRAHSSPPASVSQSTRAPVGFPSPAGESKAPHRSHPPHPPCHPAGYQMHCSRPWAGPARLYLKCHHKPSQEMCSVLSDGHHLLQVVNMTYSDVAVLISVDLYGSLGKMPREF